MLEEELLNLLEARKELIQKAPAYKKNQFEKLHYHFFVTKEIYEKMTSCFEKIASLYEEVSKDSLLANIEEEQILLLECNKDLQETLLKIEATDWKKYHVRKQNQLKNLEQQTPSSKGEEKKQERKKQILEEELQIEELEMKNYEHAVRHYYRLTLSEINQTYIQLKKGVSNIDMTSFFREKQEKYQEYQKELLEKEEMECMKEYGELKEEVLKNKIELNQIEEQIHKLEEQPHRHLLKATEKREKEYIVTCAICRKRFKVSFGREDIKYFLTPTGGIYSKKTDRIGILKNDVERKKRNSPLLEKKK